MLIFSTCQHINKITGAIVAQLIWRLYRLQRSHGVNISRTKEQASVMEAMTKHPWISIVGLSGVGKTHLAWQVATQWCKEQHWDVVFCDATETIKPAGMLQRLIKSLDIEYTGSDAPATHNRHSQSSPPQNQRPSKGSVLIIDNAERI